IFSMVTAATGLILLAAAIEAYLNEPLSNWRRILIALGGIGLIMPFTETAAGGGALIAIAFVPAIINKAQNR
ncbi:MAG: hypothetical protein QGF09_08250, partial [Rhodospirillales bacterium]|nr:hypothetical protein [Rhodospirillales bacterium]